MRYASSKGTEEESVARSDDVLAEGERGSLTGGACVAGLAMC